MAKTMEPESGNQQARKLLAAVQREYAHTECRDDGHDWRLIERYFVGRELVRVKLCNHCGTEKHMRIDRRGVTKSRYVYPSDYRIDSEISQHIGHTRHFWRGIAWMQAKGQNEIRINR